MGLEADLLHHRGCVGTPAAVAEWLSGHLSQAREACWRPARPRRRHCHCRRGWAGRRDSSVMVGLWLSESRPKNSRQRRRTTPQPGPSCCRTSGYSSVHWLAAWQGGPPSRSGVILDDSTGKLWLVPALLRAWLSLARPVRNSTPGCQSPHRHSIHVQSQYAEPWVVCKYIRHYIYAGYIVNCPSNLPRQPGIWLAVPSSTPRIITSSSLHLEFRRPCSCSTSG